MKHQEAWSRVVSIMAIPVVEFHVRGYNIILIIQSLKYMKVFKIFIEGISKGGLFSESVMTFFQISKSQKKNIPKNYPKLEI